jgi:Flp pilus assembly pilin Flp
MNVRRLNAFRKLVARSEEGQTMAEYGVVLGVIVLGVIISIGLLSLSIESYFADVASKIGGLLP